MAFETITTDIAGNYQFNDTDHVALMPGVNGGADLINGAAGDDVIDGGADNDTLDGGAGDDTISGDAGDVLIFGGPGRDFLLGKTGGDTFVFETVAEISDGPSDRILDVARGDDRIDVSGIGEDFAFAFRGTAGFTANGTADVRYAVNAANTAIVSFDADGDGAQDAGLLVLKAPLLTASGFVL